ncbi:hypothetical protein TNCV_3162731 [Trichonephila clavipes]|nr:hypothetical protein TNCV_3162731 [Trichonephila clavipes]
MLHQDKAPVYSTHSVKQFLKDKRFTVLEYPPYLLDLEPYDFYLFLSVKNALIRTHFQSVGKTPRLDEEGTPNEA